MNTAQVQEQKNTAMDDGLQQIMTRLSEKHHLQQGQNSGKKILVVDDEDNVRKLVETFLTESGFVVNSFSDGLEAVHCFVEKRHDLVLTDINMPGITGIILADYIKSQDSRIPIFAITGTGFLAEGLFDEVINKPLNLNVLLQLMQSYFMADCLHD
ncbi:MAG: response regulator [Desulforhopalus sp.]